MSEISVLSKEPLLLWFDLETTGLDEETDTILEVGWGVTGLHLGWVVHPVSYVIDNPVEMHVGKKYRSNDQWVSVRGKKIDPYVANMHDTSGLWRDILRGPTIPLGKAEQTIISVLETYAGSKISMAGSGVSQFDMRWVRRQMPDLHEMLTYYSIDIGTFERVDSVLRGGGLRSSRGAAEHRAVDDIVFAHRLALAYRAFLLTGAPFDRNDP